MFMLIFAGVAMFVGAFIINNTFSITVAQRTKEMAMLRSIGAVGRQVMRAVLLEAAIVGLVGLRSRAARWHRHRDGAEGDARLDGHATSRAGRP